MSLLAGSASGQLKVVLGGVVIVGLDQCKFVHSGPVYSDIAMDQLKTLSLEISSNIASTTFDSGLSLVVICTY
jgi:hypothetical protein